MNIGTWNVESKSYCFSGLVLVALVSICLLIETGDHGSRLINNQQLLRKEVVRNESQTPRIESRIMQNGPVPGCNIFSGRWIFDNTSYPLYKEAENSYVTHEFHCKKNGRKDHEYQHWRWQPHECDLPRFNGSAFLEKIRGKKLFFVGDSLNRNQWASLVYLIESSISPSSQKSVTKEGMYTFQTAEYNATIAFYWSPFLVESNCDDPYNHPGARERIVGIKSIGKHARHWNDADILVFNSFMWWLPPTMKILWGSFESPDAIVKSVQMRLRLYEMGLTTWSNWLEININKTKTKLFFMSLSPYHVQGENYNDNKNCYNETKPVSKEEYRGFDTDPEMMRIAESAIEELHMRGIKMQFLNITQLSDYRRDAHPSIYRYYYNTPPSREELLNNPTAYMDCTHWCLPGVPDVWNEILYSYIINS